jgi:predicted ABC-type ATPase
MTTQPKSKDSDEERENVQRMNAYLGCRGTHRNAQGQLMPCSSEENLNRVSNRAEPGKKVRKRRRRNDEFEKLRSRGVLGIDTLPGGGLVSAPITVKSETDSPRMKRRKARSDREAATPAPSKDRVVGSLRNPKGTASSTSSGSEIELDDSIELALKNKVKQHNEKMRSAGKPDYAMASLRNLKVVYRRGAGAFSVSHRPGKSRGQWAMARVNAFLYLLEKGKPRNVRYVTDNDLLPSGHPKSTKDFSIDFERKSAFKRIGRGLRRVVPFIQNARDKDKDNIVQEGTTHERPAKPNRRKKSKKKKPKKERSFLRRRKLFQKKPKVNDDRLSAAFDRPSKRSANKLDTPEVSAGRAAQTFDADSDFMDIYGDVSDPFRGGKYPGPPLTPEVIDGFRDGSAQKHLVSDGKGGLKFSPEREALHDQIIARILEGKPSRLNPTVVMMGGGPASGKSSIIKRSDFEAPEGDSALIDADMIKHMLPEMNEMINGGGNPSMAAAFVHKESTYLLRRVHGQAMANRHDIILDGTGNNDAAYNQARVDQARKAGYRVVANYVSIDVETALVRSKIREMLENRGVPWMAIVDNHAKISEIFEEINEMFDDLSLWDTSEPDPILVGRTNPSGKFEILDQKAYDRFIAKGSQVIDEEKYQEIMERNKDFIDEAVANEKTKRQSTEK